jgi:hypothetical protein
LRGAVDKRHKNKGRANRKAIGPGRKKDGAVRRTCWM